MTSFNVNDIFNRVLKYVDYIKKDKVIRNDMITKYSLKNLNMEEFDNYFDRILYHKCMYDKKDFYSDVEFERLFKLIEVDELNDYFKFANEYLDFNIRKEENLLTIVDKVLYFKGNKYFNVICEIINKDDDIDSFFKYYDYYSLDLDILISFINYL